jgi:type II secretory pathway predicted ATPase ExeA
MADKSKTHWGLRLDAFRKRYGLSHVAMADLTNNRIARSTFQRICTASIHRRGNVLRPIVADSLREFLRSREVSAYQIEQEVCAIICDDQSPTSKEDMKAVLTQRTVLARPALNFFGLRFDAFSTDPRNRNEVFTTPKLDRIAEHLEDAIRFQGFLAVIGDVGSGKSLLKKRVVQSCADSKGKLEILWPQFFNMERVHSGSISAFILRKYGQKVPTDLIYRAERLRGLLASMAEEGIHVALGFDECHRLHANLLTALKNFWELGSGGFDRYLGLVLFGQPRFEMTLRNVEFREIAERLDIVRMPDLSKQDDAWKYVSLRLKTAGGVAGEIFDRAAIDKLATISATPLALGNMANAALMKAFEFNQRKVTKDILISLLGDDTDGGPAVRAVRERR